jgi:hypothetical protein
MGLWRYNMRWKTTADEEAKADGAVGVDIRGWGMLHHGGDNETLEVDCLALPVWGDFLINPCLRINKSHNNDGLWAT